MLSYRLRHRVRIEYPKNLKDPETGAVEELWSVLKVGTTELDSVPAEVLTGPGREFAQSGSIQSEVAARISMRWFPGLTQRMRIIWDGVIYNIGSIETDVTDRREYRIRCTGGVNNG